MDALDSLGVCATCGRCLAKWRSPSRLKETRFTGPMTRICAAVLADIAAAAGLHGLSRAVQGQGEPDPLFLGSYGSGMHTVFRAHRPSAPQHAGTARPRDARCLFARGKQLRILARRAGPRASSSRSIIVTPTPSRPATRSMPLRPRRPLTTGNLASSFCRMRPCASRRTRTVRCSSFSRAPMRRRRIVRSGIKSVGKTVNGGRWTVSSEQRASDAFAIESA